MKKGKKMNKPQKAARKNKMLAKAADKMFGSQGSQVSK
jgi:hypothetical protein